MLLNRSADHALRAVLFLAGNGGGEPVAAEVVARAIGVPANYLGKVLNVLVRERVLHSLRGPRGGFSLAVAPQRLKLGTVVGPFHDLDERRPCLLGARTCDPQHPCTAHQHWRRMSDPVTAFFRDTTVADLLAPLDEGDQDRAAADDRSAAALAAVFTGSGQEEAM